MSDPADAVSPAQTDALDGFLGKWRARWPEWPVAEVFVPGAQRATALAWASLQQELTDAAWGGQDPRPGEVKLAWWQEELLGWAAGRRRHPLGGVLQRLPAPWAALAAALPALTASRERARDPDEARASLGDFAEAVAAIDTALFAAGHAEQTTSSDALVVAASLLATRAQAGDGNVPLSLLAQHDPAAALARWRDYLIGHWPQVAASTRPRRLWAALAQARLRRVDPAAALPSWRALATAWQGARAARN